MRCTKSFGVLISKRISVSQTTRPYNNKQNKKKACKIVDFALPADNRVKLKESKKKDQYLDLTKEQKKTLEPESDVYTDYNWCPWYSHQMVNKGTGGRGNIRLNWDHPNYCIIEIGQNTEKSPGNLRRFAVTQTPLKDHLLTIMGKSLNEWQ